MTRKKYVKRGKLIDHGVRLMPHEVRTIEFFLERGEDIEILVPNNTEKNKNADWLLYGKIWEAKGPQADNINTLTVMLKRASRQSMNLIVDLRRIRGDELKVIKLIRKKFVTSKRFKCMMLITKEQKLIEWKKG